MRQIVAQEVLEEATDRRPAAIACRSAIRSLHLDVIQEARYRIGINVTKLQGRNPFAALLGDESEQHRQRIAVGTDGVDACTSLPWQVLREVRLHLSEQRRRAAHGKRRLPRRCCSKRWLASCSNSGVALR